MTLKHNIKNQLLIGVSIFCAYFTRDVGLFLIPTLFIFQLQQIRNSKKRYLEATIPYLVFGLLLLLVKIKFPNGGENHFEMLLANLSFSTIFDNLAYYLYLYSKGFSFNTGILPIGFLFLVFTTIGAFSNFKRYLPFILFTALNIGILLIWPYKQGYRFLFPTFPFILFFGIKGLIFSFKELEFNKRHLQMSMSILLVFFALSSFLEIKKNSEISSNEAYTSEMNTIYNYISQYVKSDEVIAFHKPRVLALNTNKTAIFTDINNFETSIANYLLVPRSVINDPSPWEVKHCFDKYILLKK
jgi:hypothetical protein